MLVRINCLLGGGKQPPINPVLQKRLNEKLATVAKTATIIVTMSKPMPASRVEH